MKKKFSALFAILLTLNISAFAEDVNDLVGLGMQGPLAEKIATGMEDGVFSDDVTVGDDLTVTGTATIGNVVRAVTVYVPAGMGHVGATAGWSTANNTGEAQLPASQTASTFVIPLAGLHVGDTVSAMKVVAQIESAGNTATLDADCRKLTNAAGDPTDASIGAITQVSVTADTAVASSKTFTTAETIATGEMLYVLITGTTAASTDQRLQGIELTVTRNN